MKGDSPRPFSIFSAPRRSNKKVNFERKKKGKTISKQPCHMLLSFTIDLNSPPFSAAPPPFVFMGKGTNNDAEGGKCGQEDTQITNTQKYKPNVKVTC